MIQLRGTSFRIYNASFVFSEIAFFGNGDAAGSPSKGPRSPWTGGTGCGRWTGSYGRRSPMWRARPTSARPPTCVCPAAELWGCQGGGRGVGVSVGDGHNPVPESLCGKCGPSQSAIDVWIRSRNKQRPTTDIFLSTQISIFSEEGKNPFVFHYKQMLAVCWIS